MRSDRTCSIIETDKATGGKDPCVRDESYVDVAVLVVHTPSGTAFASRQIALHLILLT